MQAFKQTLTPSELVDCLGGITIQGVYKALKTHKIDKILTDKRRWHIPSLGIRKLFEERGFEYPKKTISFQIVKGGVGKTSLSFSLALRASHYGARILAIDLDQQGNLTRSFNIDARDKPVWLNVFRGKVPVEKAIVKVSDNLHVIPSNLDNSRLEVELISFASNLKDLIRDIIAPVRDYYDLVIIDCPPAINNINAAASCASDMVIIPINPDPYAMDGLDYTIHELNRIKKEFKIAFDYRIVWNKFDARERLGAFFMHELMKRKDIVDCIVPVVCRIDASLRNAVIDAKSIFELPKKAPIREDIDQFTKEILGINAWKDKKKNEDL